MSVQHYTLLGIAPRRGHCERGKRLVIHVAVRFSFPRSCSTIGDPSWSSSIDCDDMLFMAIPELSLDCATGRPLISNWMSSSMVSITKDEFLPLREGLGRSKKVDPLLLAATIRFLSLSFSFRRFPNRSTSSTDVNASSSGRVADTAAQSGSFSSWRLTSVKPSP